MGEVQGTIWSTGYYFIFRVDLKILLLHFNFPCTSIAKCLVSIVIHELQPPVKDVYSSNLQYHICSLFFDYQQFPPPH